MSDTTREEAIEYFESQKKELEYFKEMYPSPEDEGYKDTTKEIGFVDMAISALKDIEKIQTVIDNYFTIGRKSGYECMIEIDRFLEPYKKGE